MCKNTLQKGGSLVGLQCYPLIYHGSSPQFILLQNVKREFTVKKNYADSTDSVN